VAWVESTSASFAARHESDEVDAAAAVLDSLERFRVRLGAVFERTPAELTLVLHPRPLMLALAHPWLPLARLVASPAGRRYFVGWFTTREIHALSPAALERRASRVPGSREALLLTPQHEYAHVVLGANNPELPPPFNPRSFARYLHAAWLCEGAAAFFAGQVPHLRAAIARRLREGRPPTFPPAPRDAHLLGGTLFALLERERGQEAAAALATTSPKLAARDAIEQAFRRPAIAVERDWRTQLSSLTSP
jgi:hypothetical protein